MSILKGNLGTLATLAVGLTAMFGLPQTLDMFAIMQLTLYVVLSIYAISLAYIWGYGGLLCFGQAAFFGLGGYVFAVAGINMGDTTVPFLLGIAIPCLFAAAVGYFMFYGRLSDVYMGVVTLVVSLIMFKLINHTAGPEYTVGKARLGGFNGMPDVPVLNMPFDPATLLDPEQIFYFAFGLLLAVYLGLKLLQKTKFGRVTVAIRENETRAQLLGYDVRLHKVVVFAIGGAIAGMGGSLYATYQAFIDPNAFALVMSAQCLIWVMVGGLGTLVGPVIACWFLQYLTVYLGSVQIADNSFILGVILIAIVLLLPRGILPSLGDYALAAWQRLRPPSGRAEVALPVERRAEAS